MDVGPFRLISAQYSSRKDTCIAAVSLLCIVLVTFVGVVQAVHVHTDNSKLPSHECSVCSVAHSGVLSSTVYRPFALFVRTVLTASPDVIYKSSGFIFSLRIRPPPAV